MSYHHFTVFDEVLAFSFVIYWDESSASQLIPNVANFPVQVSMSKAGKKATWSRI